MKAKEEMVLARKEAAGRLRQIADMIEQGSIRVKDNSIDVPDEVDYELELEHEEHEGKVEIELEWKTRSGM